MAAKQPTNNTNNPTFLHLAYLQQLSDLIEDKHKSQAARLGYIAKQICEKHVVHINGADAPKLRRCKACHGPITSADLTAKRGGALMKRCPLCGLRLQLVAAVPAPSRESNQRAKSQQPSDPVINDANNDPLGMSID